MIGLNRVLRCPALRILKFKLSFFILQFDSEACPKTVALTKGILEKGIFFWWGLGPYPARRTNSLHVHYIGGRTIAKVIKDAIQDTISTFINYNSPAFVIRPCPQRSAFAVSRRKQNVYLLLRLHTAFRTPYTRRTLMRLRLIKQFSPITSSFTAPPHNS